MKTVIEMAREAGLIGPEDTAHDIINYGLELWISGEGGMQTLERFAELVRADERAEVERLRSLCDEMLSELYVYRASEYLKDVTAAIRARGQV